MTVTKNKVNGSWIVSDIINGYLVTKVYYGYSKRDAIKLFKQEVNK